MLNMYQFSHHIVSPITNQATVTRLGVAVFPPASDPTVAPGILPYTD